MIWRAMPDLKPGTIQADGRNGRKYRIQPKDEKADPKTGNKARRRWLLTVSYGRVPGWEFLKRLKSPDELRMVAFRHDWGVWSPWSKV